MEPVNNLPYLYQRYVDNQATAEETDAFFALVAKAHHDGELQDLLGMTWEQVQAAPGTYPLRQLPMPVAVQGRVRSMRPWVKWAAAAVVVGLVAVTAIVFLREKEGDPVVANGASQSDISAPTTTRAQLTLADGTIIYLDSLEAGTVAEQQHVNVIRTEDGRIVYRREGGIVSDEVTYNTLSNPRGSKVIDITLSDGSHVWLNAGSAITYPVAFAGSERNISISGEGYFEVAHDAKKPFTVSKGELAVQVLGTKFNVNAYDDEQDIKVTLIEGSVAVKTNRESIKIRPGQQAIATSDLKLTTNNAADLGRVLSWQRGLFEFNQTELPVILRQISRWYDVDIIYEAPPTGTQFGGGISRNLPLRNVLKLLEANGVKFRLEGKKLYVKP